MDKPKIKLTQEEKREAFGEGPWVYESDFRKIFPKGLPCRVIRVIREEVSGQYFGGHFCGYLELPESLFSVERSFLEERLSVHGGITYDEISRNKRWIGFDCAHAGDLVPSLHKFGADPVSPFFKNDYKTEHFVIEELRSLAKQVRRVEAVYDLPFIPGDEKENHWRSVKVLPKASGRYIVCDGNVAWAFVAYYRERKFYNLKLDKELEHVTHWMEIPGKPYEHDIK